MLSLHSFTNLNSKNINVDKKITLSYKTIFYLKQFFNLLKDNNNHDHSYTFKKIDKNILLKSTNFISNNTINVIKKNNNYLYTSTFLVNRIKIVLQMYCDKNDKLNIQYMKLIFSWVHIITKFVRPNCIRELHIDIYFSNLTKQITNSNLTIDNINSGYTTGGCNKINKIVIYRKEEWFKVLIHETIHALALDFSYVDNSYINSELNKKFPLNIDFKSYESYCESWAVIWNTVYHSFNEASNNVNQFIKIFRIKYTRECIFSYYQMNKILNHMNIQYSSLYDNDVTSKKKQNKYSEYTSIISYFVFKTIIIQNINDFFNFCEGQPNLISFNINKNNMHKYSILIINNYNNIKLISHTMKYNKGLRFTLHDFS